MRSHHLQFSHDLAIRPLPINQFFFVGSAAWADADLCLYHSGFCVQHKRCYQHVSFALSFSQHVFVRQCLEAHPQQFLKRHSAVQSKSLPAMRLLLWAEFQARIRLVPISCRQRLHHPCKASASSLVQLQHSLLRSRQD